ncbi:hypothetical protein CIHG_06403 [Coccidioides immitis H538.4]|uniref:Uncharacterized protein n=1 Tax=Coccidioides immitis H538.4 TaxID=396776 RepID=A0A0J8RU94_COCIT|nr:hypothetical protein CIHG_06403 [Coccidioides immitis H538.4]
MHGGNPEAQPTQTECQAWTQKSSMHVWPCGELQSGLQDNCLLPPNQLWSDGLDTRLWMYRSHHDATTSSRTSTF